MLHSTINPRSAVCENVFVGEGYFTCALTIGELDDLQAKFKIGPFALLNRLRDGSWFIEHVSETIRLGLIGGGMDQEKAYGIVARAIRPGYYFHYALKAAEIVAAAVIGDELDPVGESEATPVTTSRTPPVSSSGQASTS